MKRLTNDEKISKIISEREEIICDVKQSIDNNIISTEAAINDVLSVIEFDDKSIKEYQAIIKAKELITNLTYEIINSDSPEEIVSIRNRVNYYIKKIRNILKQRGVKDSDINYIMNNISKVRKNYAKYIRVLNRNSKINEIILLNDNIDDLSIEDKERLKRLLKNEMNYVRRNNPSSSETFNNHLDDNDIVINELDNNVNTVKETPNKLDNVDIIEDWNLDYNIDNKKNNNEIIEKETTVGDDSILRDDSFVLDFDNITTCEEQPYIYSEPEDGDCVCPLDCKLFDDNDIDSYIERFKYYEEKYHPAKIHEYGSSFLKNIIIFFQNLKRYRYNNKVISELLFTYHRFYRGKDLKAYILYIENMNSIKNAIRIIFKNSVLNKREDECIIEHDSYMNWLNNYLNCKNMIRTRTN